MVTRDVAYHYPSFSDDVAQVATTPGYEPQTEVEPPKWSKWGEKHLPGSLEIGWSHSSLLKAWLTCVKLIGLSLLMQSAYLQANMPQSLPFICCGIS